MAEVLVIGAGMAGAVAALSAARAGAKVIVARRAFAATALSSGAIDVAIDPHGRDGVSIEEAAREIARIRRDHPYAILQEKLPRLMESLKFAASALPELLSPPLESNAILVTPFGTVKPAAMAQLSQIGANLSSLPEEIAIVEFALNPLFDAKLVAAGLQAAAGRAGRTLRVHLIESRFFNGVEDAWKKPAEIAQALENPGAIEKWALEIRNRLPPSARMVLIPPVLGRHSLRTWSKLSSLLNLPCAEALSASFSIPGLRLQTALDGALRAAGIDLIEGEVRRGTNGFSIGADRTVNPDGVVVATGRFISGGITKQGVLREAIFGLPVYVGSQSVGRQYLGQWLSAQFADEQRLFRAGIRIDKELRPLDFNGDPFNARVYAAGSVIGGYDPAADKTGLGVAAFTGFLAGENAAKAGAV
jgi:glycerol-3-phosphate dehydrogenase subunit B